MRVKRYPHPDFLLQEKPLILLEPDQEPCTYDSLWGRKFRIFTPLPLFVLVHVLPTLWYRRYLTTIVQKANDFTSAFTPIPWYQCINFLHMNRTFCIFSPKYSVFFTLTHRAGGLGELFCPTSEWLFKFSQIFLFTLFAYFAPPTLADFFSRLCSTW